jgi:hypothetical protein
MMVSVPLAEGFVQERQAVGGGYGHYLLLGLYPVHLA